MCDFSQYGGPSEEWLAVQNTLPPLPFDLNADPLVLQRTVNAGRESLALSAMASLSSKVHTTDHTIPTRDGTTIEARSYRPVSKPKGEVLPVYLYFHGGGFVFGTIASEDPVCASIASKIGVVVVNVNYRHTPQVTFPTAWEDAQDAFLWLHRNISSIHGDPEKVVVGGVSAGGQLTASLVLEKHLGRAKELEGLPAPAGQVLIIPVLGASKMYAQGPGKRMKSVGVSSMVENENAPLLPKKVMEFFEDLLKTPERVDMKDTKLNIVNFTEEEVKGMPPTVFGIAGLDPLRDEGLLYAKTLSEAGVPTRVGFFKGVPHGFRRFGPALRICEKYDETIEQGILWALGKPGTTGKFDVDVV